ncbi:MAG TPA: phosphatase PAP2 family protein [Syntrophales bacterium]|nr:phosphatase PAP2 family protein [Syntrophales bacterium]
MKFFYDWNLRLNLEEKLVIAMMVLLNSLILLFMQMKAAWDIFALNLIIILFILIVSLAQTRRYQRYIPTFRDWYVLLFLVAIYLENRRLIPLVNPHDVDNIIIHIDRFLFLGTDPTILMETITFPMLSEVCQIVYASFYFLPLSLCLALYFVKRSHLDFHVCASTLMIGFFVSYLGYYLTPAIGPRFTLTHLQTVPLTGILFFDLVRDLLARGEGVMRDCCPSGHTLISLLTILLVRKYYRPLFPVTCVWGSVIIFSTVYLRYHYVTDLIIGTILGLVVYSCVPSLSRALILGNGKPKDSVLANPFREE